jgi:hypothetical protein
MAVVIRAATVLLAFSAWMLRSLCQFSAASQVFGDIGNVLATALSRTKFQEELRETAAQLKAIVETAVDGIITIK